MFVSIPAVAADPSPLLPGGQGRGRALATKLVRLNGGKSGVAQTLRLMRSIVNASKIDTRVRLTAMQLVKPLTPKDWLGEVKALHAFVRDRIRYVRDIEGVETLQTPEKTLQFGQGDCDDKSMLLAALLKSIGHPARFVAVGFKPRQFSHVYVETRIGSTWVALETTVAGWPVGKAPPGIVSRLVRKV